jgi:hypothetical protein
VRRCLCATAGNNSQSRGQDYKFSWSPESLPYITDFPDPYMHAGLAILPVHNLPDDGLSEGLVARRATEMIATLAQRRRTRRDTRPFFLAVGFRRCDACPA